MRFEWLRSFAVFAEEMNFTRAAERLHLSQPAVHVQIKGLADYLGTALYFKRGRALVLTDAGRQTEAFARDLLDREAGFSESIQTGRASQPVVLCAGEGAYLHLLGDALKKYHRGKHRPPLSLMTGDRDATIESLLSGRAHVGVTVVKSVPEGISAQTLTKVEYAVALPKKHPLAKRRALTVQDLDGVSLIVPPTGRPMRTDLDLAFAQAGTQFEVAIECVGWQVKIEFVRLGLGLAVVNGFCRVPSLLTLRALKDLSPVQYSVVVRAGGPIQRAEQLLRLLELHRNDWRKRSRSLRTD